jgi:hypothetical protein
LFFFASSKSFFSSATPVLVAEQARKSALNFVDNIFARVVFQHQGGPQKIID